MHLNIRSLLPKPVEGCQLTYVKYDILMLLKLGSDGMLTQVQSLYEVTIYKDHIEFFWVYSCSVEAVLRFFLWRSLDEGTFPVLFMFLMDTLLVPIPYQWLWYPKKRFRANVWSWFSLFNTVTTFFVCCISWVPGTQYRINVFLSVSSSWHCQNRLNVVFGFVNASWLSVNILICWFRWCLKYCSLHITRLRILPLWKQMCLDD